MSQTIDFKYVALDRTGRQTRGTVAATTEHAAYRQLSSEGLTPVKLERVNRAGGRRRVVPEDVATLTRELNVLVEARIPLARGLVSVAENETNPALASMVRDIAARIESGQTISEAFDVHRGVFGDVYVETLKAAEQSGSLDSITAHLAEMLERAIEMRKQLVRALSYPMIVVGFVALALTVIVVFVVPRFAVIFEQNGVSLPITTRVVQAIGESAKVHWYLYVGGIIGAVGSCVIAWRSEEGRRWFERALLRVPHVSGMIVAMTAARFSSVLSIAMGAGLDLTDAIAMSGRATGRPLFVTETAHMADRLRSGDGLSEVLRSSRYLPSFARRLLGAGKDAKELAAASAVIARHYDRESDHLAKSVSTLVEPIMTIALAGIVLLVALSVFLPMWQMIKMSQG